MSSVLRTLVLTSSLTAFAAIEAAAAEYLCRQKDSSLRIAIEVKKAGHTLPCEVVVEDDRGERAVLYSAQYDRDYCPSRIEKAREDLEQKGWSCQKTSDQSIVSAADSSGGGTDIAPVSKKIGAGNGSAPIISKNGKTIAASRQCRLGDDRRRVHVEVEDPGSGRPCELIYWEDGDQSKPGELLWRAEHDATFCPTRLDVIIGRWISEGWTCDIDDVQAAAVVGAPEQEAVNDPASAAQQAEAETGDEVDVPTADSRLEAVVAADAERIGEWMEVEPTIEIVAHGDLNNDGSDDAVVFLAYQSDQSAYRQYLMSYLVDGDDYELASVKLLTGVNPPPAQARVEQIAEGIIWLTLPDRDGATPRQIGYRLRDQQLIEVEPDTSVNAGN